MNFFTGVPFGLHRVAPYYYIPAFHEPGPALEVTINRSRYEALPADLQKIVQYAISSVAGETLADFTCHNIQALLEQHGVELRAFPEPVVEEMGRITAEVLENLAAADELTGRVYASFRDCLGKAVPYSERMLGTLLRWRTMVVG